MAIGMPGQAIAHSHVLVSSAIGFRMGKRGTDLNLGFSSSILQQHFHHLARLAALLPAAPLSLSMRSHFSKFFSSISLYTSTFVNIHSPESVLNCLEYATELRLQRTFLAAAACSKCKAFSHSKFYMEGFWSAQRAKRNFGSCQLL